MADCEKCLHYNACQGVLVNFYSKTIERKIEFCENFTDKNKFVEVVRCKDCAVPYNRWTGCPRLSGLIPPPDFYCASGTRKNR